MYNHLLYFSYWLVNSFAISLFNYLFPNNFVLGNWKLTALEASLYSGFWLTFVVWIFWDFLMAKKYELGKFKSFIWFWLANTIGVWIVAHMSGFTGFGIESFYLSFILGFFANILQRLIRKVVTKTV